MVQGAASRRASRAGTVAVAFVAMLLAVSSPGRLQGRGAAASVLPGTYPVEWSFGDALHVRVNSLRSAATELPYDYYALPYCVPEGGPQRITENLGELLHGDRIESSPYVFHALRPEMGSLCKRTLSKADAASFATFIREGYRAHMILDNLPVTTADLASARNGTIASAMGDGSRPLGEVQTGFPVGALISGEASRFDVKLVPVIHNHLAFTVLVHPIAVNDTVRVVGFEVEACSARDAARGVAKGSVRRDSAAGTDSVCDGATIPVYAREGETFEFSYSVAFRNSSTEWVTRWDAYLQMGDASVHWFSIANSATIVLFIGGIVGVILAKTVRRDLARYETLVQRARPHTDGAIEDSGWKLVSADVFRPPARARRLSVFIGTGVQTLCVAVATVAFAALGFLSPASRGSLLSAIIVAYVLLGFVGGYVCVSAHKFIVGTSHGWLPLALQTAVMMPGITFATMMLVNMAIWRTGSSGATPVSALAIMAVLWTAAAVPLTVAGAFASSKVAPEAREHHRSNQIPRQIPPSAHGGLLISLAAGLLPFSTVFMEAFFIMQSVWLKHTYYLFGILTIVLALSLLVTAEATLCLVYMQLCAENYRWWWPAWHMGGSVAAYVATFSVIFFFKDLERLQAGGWPAVVMYFSYMGLASMFAYFALGAASWASAAWFVNELFRSLKAE